MLAMNYRGPIECALIAIFNTFFIHINYQIIVHALLLVYFKLSVAIS